MGNSLRCCLACVLPCGALDLIRIVHLNGYVEEITSPITAGEVLKANPNHVLSKPCSQGVVRRILILSPESELKRGSIYFLIPASSLPERKKGSNKKSSKKSKKCFNDQHVSSCDPYLTDIISDKKPSRRDRRSGSRVPVWQPHLESISEDWPICRPPESESPARIIQWGKWGHWFCGYSFYFSFFGSAYNIKGRFGIPTIFKTRKRSCSVCFKRNACSNFGTVFTQFVSN